MVNLAQEIGVIQDRAARSLSYYCTEDIVGIDDGIVEQLLQVSTKNDYCDARICLHSGPDDSFHEAIILQYRKHYYRPHIHPNKGESCHIIRGQLCFFVFNDDGTVADKRVVGESDSVMYRAGVDRWHTVIPVTDFVVYHESKPGPYLRNRDSVFPHWAPDSLDPKESRRYMDHLLALAEDGK
ncbi:cupin fold metalloprotein, WbuC family [SAR202 cluster bacterium AD-802-F09_MRT_200m]|nr:cupin fold metalloprotein, WbuC family [SAR202 cluster bacterium AD-802-F09_MRT_200m]